MEPVIFKGCVRNMGVFELTK